MSLSESFALAVFFLTFFPLVGFLFFIGNRANAPRKTSTERLIDYYLDRERSTWTHKVVIETVEETTEEPEPIPVDPTPLVTPAPTNNKN